MSSTRKERRIPKAQIVETFDKGVVGADESRLTGLQGLLNLRSAKTTQLQREQQRLSQTLGPGHARVLALDDKIAVNQGLYRDLEVEVDRAGVEVPGVDKAAWVLHGFVRDQQLKGQPNLTVALYDQLGQWIEQLGFACTENNGYFKLESADIRGETDGLQGSIRVTDKDKNLLYCGTEVLIPEGGRVVSREIFLPEEGVASCSPPGPSTGFVPVQVLSINGPGQAITGDSYTFTATTNEDATEPVAHQWDFGDGTTASGLSATHSYANEGDYTVAFTASNNGGSATKTLEVTVVIPAKIISVTSHPRTLREGTRVQFTHTVEGTLPLAYRWDFGDGATGTTVNPRHPYMQAGTYTVTLKVSNEAGEDESTLTVEIKPKRTGGRRTKKDDP